MNGKYKLNYFKGIFAEFYVLFFLILKGYRPVKWRMRNIISEIDLIVKKNNVLIAVEIKYRQSHHQGLFSISKQQQVKIRNAFELFSSKKTYADYEKRFDVCIVTSNFKIYHHKNSF
jgi:putative endonuclease